jgi:hypothetical protein
MRMVSPLGGASSAPAAFGTQATTAPSRASSAAMMDGGWGVSNLTAKDWAVVSAAVGFKCGPDENGVISGPQPAIAFAMDAAHENGSLGDSSDDLKAFFKNMANAGGQQAGIAAQASRAVDYLMNLDGSSRLGLDTIA